MQPQALYDVLKDRRSINLRDLLPDPIEPTSLEQMLEAANWAPSHGHTEPWRFTIFVGEARRTLGEVLAEAYRLGTPASVLTRLPWHSPAPVSFWRRPG